MNVTVIAGSPRLHTVAASTSIKGERYEQEKNKNGSGTGRGARARRELRIGRSGNGRCEHEQRASEPRQVRAKGRQPMVPTAAGNDLRLPRREGRQARTRRCRGH